MTTQDEVQAAFRAELATQLRGALGPNMRVVLALTRLPGLTTVQGAQETARALRAIAGLLDDAGAPESMGHQFVGNLVAAAIGARLRGPARPWGGADTIELLVEMQVRQTGTQDAEPIRRALQEYVARQERKAVVEPTRSRVDVLFGRRPRD